MKKLLLLGLLRSQQLHGYGLVDYLKSHASGGAAIGKSNAYRLLKVLEEDGCVVSRVERDGNRPERNVYEVTEVGERLFQELMQRYLADDGTADQPGLAVLHYINEVDPGVAAECLQLRLNKVQVRYQELLQAPKEVLYLHPALDLTLKQLTTEVEWLEEQIKTLKNKATEAA